MPNWVWQIMSITKGDPQAVWNAIRSENSLFDFDKLLPMPDEVKTSKELVGKFQWPAWYAWALANWGTKWNASNVGFRKSEDSGAVELYFQTPWWCPDGIFELLAKKFPRHEIVIRAYECLGCWHATYFLKDGRFTSSIEECSCIADSIAEMKREE